MTNINTIEPISDKNAITIVFAPDNYYCKYFSIALKSLIDNACTEKVYDIIILAVDITERNKKILEKMLPKNFRLRIININNFIQNQFKNLSLAPKGHWSINMYYRLFIPMLMPNYEKVLYLDSDICILDSLKELWDTDFDDKKMIVVKDCDAPVFYKNANRLNNLINILKLKDIQTYFNSGMTFFNLKNIDITEYTNALKEAFTIEKLAFPDQDILNVIFEDTKKFVSCKWNFQYHTPIFHPNYLDEILGEDKADYIQSKENPCLIHFTSHIKPWSYPNEEFAEYFWEYARKSPFYEEILFDNLVLKKSLKMFWQRNKIRLTYEKCKLFAKFSKGLKRTHYKAKESIYKRMLDEIKSL